jgi:ATP-dependent Clp protease ATP-binding subunit ClpA
VFDRFSDRARKVMGLARQEAQRFNHDYIGTEHILLGLVQEGSGVAASVLKNLDVDLKKIRQEVEKLVSTGTTRVTTGQLPFTPRAKKVLELSLAEAGVLGHRWIGTEHLLLGLVAEREGIAAQALRNLKVEVEDVRTGVLGLLGADPTERNERRAGGVWARESTLSARVVALLDAATEQGSRLGRTQVQPEHVLVAVLGDGVVADVLREAGVDAKRLREDVLRILTEPPRPGGAPRD